MAIEIVQLSCHLQGKEEKLFLVGCSLPHSSCLMGGRVDVVQPIQHLHAVYGEVSLSSGTCMTV